MGARITERWHSHATALRAAVANTTLDADALACEWLVLSHLANAAQSLAFRRGTETTQARNWMHAARDAMVCPRMLTSGAAALSMSIAVECALKGTVSITRSKKVARCMWPTCETSPAKSRRDMRVPLAAASQDVNTATAVYFR